MMNPNLDHDLEVRFAKVLGEDELSFGFHLELAARVVDAASQFDPLLKRSKWLISTGERESSYLYPAFDAGGPTSTALAVLRESGKRRSAIKSFSLWNGHEEQGKGASIACYFGRQDGAASSFKLSIRSPRETMRLGAWRQVAETLASSASIFSPIYGSVGTMYYDAVFKDRAGVGWMLYLPHVLTAQQVPEARALVPVMSASEGAGKPKQLGTIIVSVTDEPFSDENPEHIKIANAIEIRLVDQDLLPRYADL